MKTKNKILASLEIAIVLCSVFLVAIPAIAADQNHEMQKVSASAITTASEDDYVLEIYGNANEDDTIDMGDVVYTKLAIFGKKPKTKLCDAKYDGRINVLDVIQTKLIILGKEKELTIVDTSDRIVTVKKPIKRIVVMYPAVAEAMRVLIPMELDKVVGAGSLITGQGEKYKKYEIMFPVLNKLPSVGGFSKPDYEAILSLYPDVFFCNFYRPWGMDMSKIEENLPSITVIAFDFLTIRRTSEEMKKFGYILGKKDAAEEFIDWYEEICNNIKEQTAGLSEDKKPRVFLSRLFRGTFYCTGTGVQDDIFHELCVMAGGRNIAADLPSSGSYINVDPEWVIKENPDIIVVAVWPGVEGGYAADDPSGMKEVRDMVMNSPELAKVTAVKKGNVFVINYDIWASPSRCSVAPAYYAKWFHPELLEDLDPEAIHQEYVTRFQHLDYDLDKHGVFVYPPLED